MCLLFTDCVDCGVSRTLADGLQIVDAFVKFVICEPCSSASYQHLRLSLISALCIKSIDNSSLIRYLLSLVPLMPVVVITHTKHVI